MIQIIKDFIAIILLAIVWFISIPVGLIEWVLLILHRLACRMGGIE